MRYSLRGLETRTTQESLLEDLQEYVRSKQVTWEYFAYPVQAIRWAIKKQVDVISISIALTLTHHQLDIAVSDAVKSGIAVICSTTDNLSSGERTYPAKMLGTISVAACDKYGRMLNWSKEEKKSYRINGKDVLAGTVPYVASEERITGNSVATAIAAGLGSLILSCCRLVGRKEDPKQPDRTIL